MNSTQNKWLLLLATACILSCNQEKDQNKETMDTTEKTKPFSALAEYMEARKSEFDQIPEDRKANLEQLSSYIGSKLSTAQIPQVTFICTHNSRRSHMSQIWAMAAAKSYGVAGLDCYSGGTEATAFNPRAVAAMERAGFTIEQIQAGDNPLYHVTYAEDAVPVKAWSKVYNDVKNPRKEFCAVMTCAQADEECPVVFGAEERIAIAYEDPKNADGSAEEQKIYDERCAQIAREMLYVFSKVKI